MLEVGTRGFELRCLVDATVLIDAVRRGFLDRLVGGNEIMVAESVLREVKYWKDDDGTRHAIDLTGYVRQGKIDVVSATADELATVVRQIGGSSLGATELELVAVVIARGMWLCTMDHAVWKAMDKVGVAHRLTSVGTLRAAESGTE